MKRSIGFYTVQPHARKQQPNLDPAALPAAVLLSAGAVLLFGSAIPGASLWALACLPLCVGLSALRRFSWSPLAVTALLAAYCAVFFRPITAGMLQYVNALLRRLTELTGRIYLPFETSEALKTGWFFAPICVLFSAFACRSVRKGELLFCGVCWPFFAAGCLLGFFAPSGLLLSAAGTAALALYREKAHSPKAFLLPLACALLLSPLALLHTDGSALPQQLADAIHHLRYDTATCTLPEGQLSDLPPRTQSTAPALDIAMQTPQKLYLRGFLGERYTGTSWTRLENSTLADDADRFYLLHKNGFYAQSSIGSAAESVDITSSSALTITNLAACSAQQYLPYALVGSETLSPEVIGDNRTHGTRETAVVQYLPGSVPDWYALQTELSAAQEAPSAALYLSQERQYREFAEKHYLQLTSEAAQAAGTMLDGRLNGRTLPEIRGAILDALDACLTYDEAAGSGGISGDFLTRLLDGGGRGYDVHYATAAVLMLRYCGVPARYVEGYYLPADEAALLSEGQHAVLTEQHAHAWAEYYLDGIGWVPFEVTPGYIDNEENTSAVASEKEYENPQLPPPVQQQPQERETPQRTPRSGWWLLVLSAVLLLITAVLRTVYRRRRLKKRLAALQNAAPRDAAAGLYGYAVYLQQQTGLTLHDEAAEALNREALFSGHEITAAQAAQMLQYVDSVRALCRTQRRPKRFWDRMIRCIY